MAQPIPPEHNQPDASTPFYCDDSPSLSYYGAVYGAIRSKIDGTFKGWNGGTIFYLTNSQVWHQTQYSYAYGYDTGLMRPYSRTGALLQISGRGKQDDSGPAVKMTPVATRICSLYDSSGRGMRGAHTEASEGIGDTSVA